MPPATQADQTGPISHTQKIRYTGTHWMPRRFAVSNDAGQTLRDYVFGATSGKQVQSVSTNDAPLFLKANADRITGIGPNDKWEAVKEEAVDADEILADILGIEPPAAEEPAQPAAPTKTVPPKSDTKTDTKPN